MEPKVEPKTYEIKSVTDFDKVPMERLADCMVEFSAFVALRRMAGVLSNNGQFDDTFRWVDDGKGEVVMRVKLPSLSREDGEKQ